MTFKKQIEDANARREAGKTAAEAQQNAKKLELKGIADKLEAHLRENKPDEVGLSFERKGARMKLKSGDYAIIIDAGFREYTAMVFVGDFPPQIARGSQRRLNTLDHVDSYITEILRNN